jgi:hypothetical protein
MADMKKNWPKTLRLLVSRAAQCNKAATYCIDHTDPELYTVRSVKDVTEGSTKEAHMCASRVLPRKVGKMV